MRRFQVAAEFERLYWARWQQTNADAFAYYNAHIALDTLFGSY